MSAAIERSTIAAGSIGRRGVSRERRDGLPPTTVLLVAGGDTRIACDPVRGVNRYGCPPSPEPSVAAFDSATASTVSEAGYAAADRLRGRLIAAQRSEPRAATYAAEMARVRHALRDLCGLSDIAGPDVIFGASGTDLHLFAVQLAGAGPGGSRMAVMVAPAETGSGVAAALSGRHFDARTALGATVGKGSAMTMHATEVAAVAIREADGSLRSTATVDGEVEALVTAAVGAGQQVLLVVADVSKTGLIAPSPAAALALRERYPGAVDVLVDACQFRLAPSTLRAYLQRGCLVALTGSKFVTGPAFSGALLVPGSSARRFAEHPLPEQFAAYSARADWPPGWMARKTLPDRANYGLLLRWEAALTELQAFRAIPDTCVTAFLEEFAAAIDRRLSNDPAFERLPARPFDRGRIGSADSWDRVQTIFPFLLRGPGAAGANAALNRDRTLRVYQSLRQDGSPPAGADVAATGAAVGRRCRLAQPVDCGTRDGVPVAALRLCASARLVIDAVTGRGPDRVIAEALGVLDEAAKAGGTTDRNFKIHRTSGC